MNAGMQPIRCIIPCLHLIHLYVMKDREPDFLIHSVLFEEGRSRKTKVPSNFLYLPLWPSETVGHT